MRNRILQSLSGLCIALQASASDDPFEMSLDELANLQVTTVTQTSQSLLRIPSSISIFTAQQIENMGVNSLEELANFVPGFQSARTGVRSHSYPITARGYSKGYTASEILVLLNGQRVNEGFSGSISAILSSVPVNNAQRIEFMRGPGSAIYGGNAFTGVINIVTQENNNELQAAVGNHQQKEIKAAYGDNALSIYGQYSEDQGQPYRNLNDANQTGVKTRYDAQKNQFFHTTYRTEKSFSQLFISQNDNDNFWINELFSEDDNPVRLDSLLFSSTYDLVFSPDIKSQLSLRYMESNQLISGQNTPAGVLSAISTPSSTEPFSGYSRFGTRDIEISIKNWFSLKAGDILLGAEYYQPNLVNGYHKGNYDLGQLSNSDYPVTYNPDGIKTQIMLDTNRRTSAVYGQFETRLYEANVIIGSRYEEYSDTGSNLSPRASVVYALDQYNSLKFLYGEAFRPPMIIEMTLQNAKTLRGNRDLKPEIIHTAEINYVHQSPAFWSESGCYQSNITDPITLEETPSVGTAKMYINSNESITLRGCETELIKPLLNASELRMGLSHQFNVTAESENHSQTLFNSSYSHKVERLTLGLNYIWQGAMKFTDTSGNHFRTGAYGLWGGHLNYAFNNNADIFFNVKNLLDRDYKTPANSSIFPDGIVNRGVEFNTGISWKL